MIRHDIKPREGWEKLVEEEGFTWHTTDEGPYWDESAYYEFSSAQVDAIDLATANLHHLCLEACGHVIEKKLFAQLGIPEDRWKDLENSWEDDADTIYGRMDLCFTPAGIKLLEYNADTPTSLLESAVIQWSWLEQVFPHLDQFNSLHDKLIARWSRLRSNNSIIRGHGVVFATTKEFEEDWGTLQYMRDTATQAGIKTQAMDMMELGWDGKNYVDLENDEIYTIFKLYPWEWLFGEMKTHGVPISAANFLEPAWKVILSCKGILPVLWELFPDHPNLLPAYYDTPRNLIEYAKKPLYSREGSNVELQSKWRAAKNDGPYDDGKFIYQGFAELPKFDDRYAVIGSWLVDDAPAGMCVREDTNPITSNLSRFVPHVIK